MIYECEHTEVLRLDYQHIDEELPSKTQWLCAYCSAHDRGLNTMVEVIIPESKWLKATDFEENDVARVIDGGKYVDAFGTQKLEIGIRLTNKKEKLATLNLTSLKRISEEYGSNSDAWVNKFVELTTVRTTVRGKVYDVVYLTPIRDNETSKVNPLVT